MNNESKPEGIYQLSEEERSAVEDGINQMENGLWISNEEANKKIDEVLGKMIL